MPTTGQPRFSPATVAAFDRLDNARARIEAADDERIAAWEDARASANPNLPRYQAALAESDAATAEMRAAFDGANEAFDDEIHAALVARFGPNGPSTWEEFERGAKETGGFGAGMVTALPGAIYDNIVAMERVVDTLTSPFTILNVGVAIGQDPAGAAAAAHRVLDGLLSGPQDPAAAAAADRAESRRELEQLLADRITAIDDPVGVGAAEGAQFSNVVAPVVLAVVTDGIGDAVLVGDEAVALDVAAGCPTCDAAAATRASSVADDAIDARGAIKADKPPELIDPPATTPKYSVVKDMEPRFRGEDQPNNSIWGGRQVKYLRGAEKEPYRLHFKDGRVFDAEGKPFDTTDAATAHSGDGSAIYVMDADGNFYASKVQTVGEFHHSSLAAGEPVASAGELVVKDGYIQEITRKSGHYRPTAEMQDQAVHELGDRGVDTSKIRKSGF